MLSRIDKLLADGAGLTRSKARGVIVSGRVKVDGEVCRDFSRRVDSNSEILLDNMHIKSRGFVYVMLNKPKGFVCSTADRENSTVLELITGYENSHIFPAGRLDKDSTGLCILTDDGELGHRITAPRTHLRKQYLVQLDIEPTDEMIEEFSVGIQLRGEKQCKPAELLPLGGKMCRVGITEGKYHQIKRMFAVLGAEVLELHRVSIGSIVLDDTLNFGEYRELTELELCNLKRELGMA